MKSKIIVTIGMMLVLLVTIGASTVWAQQPEDQESDQGITTPINDPLADAILNLSEKAFNHAFVIFTTNYTDTVIDVLRNTLIRRNLINLSDPNTLDKFIQCNNINKDAFFRDVDKSRDHLVETQVALYYAWTAYLEGNLTGAQAQYDRATKAWNFFLPVAAAVNAEIDRWQPCRPNTPSGNSDSQTNVKKQDIKVQKTIAKSTDSADSKDQKTVQKALDKTAKAEKEQQKPAKITGATVKTTEAKQEQKISQGFFARIVAFLQSLF